MSFLKPKPKYLKYVDASSTAPASELKHAQPVYITNLPAGSSFDPVAWVESITGYSASTAQTLGHDASGNLAWVAVA